ncbi:hypothetical protein SDC9_212041 [bioreactor metagenome]|uniref:Uncharacterized protein n=1 Tax=bioreactor metagenome TaxID=1076179 RepID=A0A645JMF9_9ZZZZ
MESHDLDRAGQSGKYARKEHRKHHVSADVYAVGLSGDWIISDRTHLISKRQLPEYDINHDCRNHCDDYARMHARSRNQGAQPRILREQ